MSIGVRFPVLERLGALQKTMAKTQNIEAGSCKV